MPLNEFWYGDVRLLMAYKQSYIRNKSYTAWLQGMYDMEAFGIVLANAFAKKGTPTRKYPEWVDPVEKLNKIQTKKENYQLLHHKQEMWFYNMMQS
jgi:hypothetical protein